MRDAVGHHGPRRLSDGEDGGVTLARVGDAAAEQRVVQHDDPARSQQPHALADVVRMIGGGGVDEDQVVGRVGQPWQHVQRAPVDQPGAGGRDAGLPERGLGGTLMLGLAVDGGEDAVLAQAP
ncbi:hypothetical protein AAT18_08430 [Rhodococcus aetherivorans]|nr:hypothetical protein AAT18_08430 [Rhodococcus aetherivorans]